MQKYAITAIVMLTLAAPAYGQIGALQRRAGQLQKISDIHFSDAEERELGAKGGGRQPPNPLLKQQIFGARRPLLRSILFVSQSQLSAPPF